MKHKLFITLAAISLMLAGCNKNETVESHSRVMHITATVVEPASTRATLEELSDGSIRFKWTVGDTIQMAFVQGSIKKTAKAPVTSVSPDGRTAQWNVTVPEEISNNDFTLYAYRSSSRPIVTEGSELLASNPVIAVVPAYSSDYRPFLSEQQYLVSLWDKQTVTYSGGAMPAVSLSFKHLGAMLTMKVKNTSADDISGIYAWRFESTTNTCWARNTFSSPAQFNMETNSYEGEETYTVAMVFPYAEPDVLPAGGVTPYSVWFVPRSYTPGNMIKVEAASTTSRIRGTSDTPKAAIDFQTGYNYIVYLKISGTIGNYSLQYSNAAWE